MGFGRLGWGGEGRVCTICTVWANKFANWEELWGRNALTPGCRFFPRYVPEMFQNGAALSAFLDRSGADLQWKQRHATPPLFYC